jgi:hypothetical protein
MARFELILVVKCRKDSSYRIQSVLDIQKIFPDLLRPLDCIYHWWDHFYDKGLQLLQFSRSAQHVVPENNHFIADLDPTSGYILASYHCIDELEGAFPNPFDYY